MFSCIFVVHATCLATSVLFYLSNNDSSCLSVWLQWIDTTCSNCVYTIGLTWDCFTASCFDCNNLCFCLIIVILIYSYSFICKRNTSNELYFYIETFCRFKMNEFWNSYKLDCYNIVIWNIQYLIVCFRQRILHDYLQNYSTINILVRMEQFFI